MESKILKMDRSTKIMYSLFNFFAPVSFVCIGICALDAYNSLASLVSFISIFVGLFCMIFNLMRYNRFLCINNETINVCKGKIEQPKVINIIKAENITFDITSKDLVARHENNKIKLLHTSFSLLGTICYIGPLVVIPMIKNANVALHNLSEMYQLFPGLFKTPPKTPSKKDDVVANVIAWGFVLFVSAIGCLGIFLTPFYPFMGE